MCKCLGISRSGYYDYEENKSAEQIEDIYTQKVLRILNENEPMEHVKFIEHYETRVFYISRQNQENYELSRHLFVMLQSEV